MTTYAITNRSNGIIVCYISAHTIQEAIHLLKTTTPFDPYKVGFCIL